MTVVVVGAGPVGVTAALLLARRGVDVLVVDRHAAPYPQPRAVHLDDESLRVLQDAGVADAFTAISRPMAGLRLLDGGGRVLVEFRRGAGVHGWPQASMFTQPDLEALLRRALDGEPRAALRGGVDVVALDQADGPVRLTVRDRDTGAEEVLVADAVLGCDGANSTVRRLIGARLRPLGPSERWLVVDLVSAVPLPVWPGVHQVCDPRRPATFMPVAGRRYRAEFRLAEGESPGQLDLPALLAAFGAAGAEVVRAADYRYAAGVADRWRDRRVLLCGDAAHLTPPFIGQGLGLGLRDAHQLAWKLAAVLAGADDALLDTHQAERAPHARALVRLAVLLGRLMTGGGRRGGRPAARAHRRAPAARGVGLRAGQPHAAAPAGPAGPPPAGRAALAGRRAGAPAGGPGGRRRAPAGRPAGGRLGGVDARRCAAGAARRPGPAGAAPRDRPGGAGLPGAGPVAARPRGAGAAGPGRRRGRPAGSGRGRPRMIDP